MKRFILIAISAVAAGSAFAQVPDDFKPKLDNLTVRFGYVLALNTAMKDVSANYGAFGIDVDLTQSKDVQYFAALDWLGKSFRTTKGSQWAFTGNMRKSINGDIGQETTTLSGLASLSKTSPLATPYSLCAEALVRKLALSFLLKLSEPTVHLVEIRSRATL